MYEAFYGLRQKPFRKTPDPDFLFPSRAHEEALARLQYAVEDREIMLLTGEVGCGKTTLTRALIDSLDESFKVILILNPRLSPAQFLKTLARRLDIARPERPRKGVRAPSRDVLLESIHEKLYKDHEAGITPVVIIDEAQLIPRKETFEEIRLLTNFQLDDTNLLSLLLVGQSDLGKRLRKEAYVPLRQRIGMFYHIGPIGEDEIKPYIEHRLSVAGREDCLFTGEALHAMYGYSGGVPRLINGLAASAMLEGFGEGLSLIDERVVKAAAKELGLVEATEAPGAI